MKQTLIKITDDHYVIVDDSEIKKGDWYLTFQNNEVIGELRKCEDSSYSFIHCKKITHSTQPLETLKNEYAWYGGDNKVKQKDFSKIISICLQEVKELIGEVDVEKKADDIIPNLLHKKYVKTGFIAGYNQALEDNKKRKYTEKDLRMAYKEGAKSQRFNARLDSSEKTIDETIQSLQPKTEWEVEIIDGKLKLK